jgi:hypothetical protein
LTLRYTPPLRYYLIRYYSIALVKQDYGDRKGKASPEKRRRKIEEEQKEGEVGKRKEKRKENGAERKAVWAAICWISSSPCYRRVDLGIF